MSWDQITGAFERAPFGLAIGSAEGVVLWCNDAAGGIVGRSVEDLIGRSVLDLVDDAEQAVIGERIDGGVTTGSPFVTTMRHRDGRGVPVRVSWTTLRSLGDGEAPFASVSIIEDLSELADADRQLATVVDSAPIALFGCDLDGIVTVARGHALDALALKPEDVVGRSMFEMFDAARPDITDYARRALAGEDVRFVTEWDPEWVDAWFRPVRDVTGAIRGGIGIVTLVSEQIHLQRRTEALADLSQIASGGAEVDDVLALIVRMSSTHLAPLAVLALYDEDGDVLTVRAAYHPDPDFLALVAEHNRTGPPSSADPAIAKALRSKGPIVADQTNLPMPERYESLSSVNLISARLHAPLRISGRTIGLLMTTRHDPDDPYDDGDIAFAAALADRAALAIQQAGLENARRSREVQQQAVAALGQAALRQTSFHDLLQEAIQLVAHALGDEVAVALDDGNAEGMLIVAATPGWPAESVGRRRARSGAFDPLGAPLYAHGPVKSRDIHNDPRWHPPRQNGIPAAKAALSTRLETNGEPFGVLLATRADDREYSDQDGSFLAAIANVLSAAHQSDRVADELQRAALYDALTGLPNRTLLTDRLAQALDAADSRASRVGAIVLDLDHFKLVNDSRGHDTGDTLLRDVAQRLVDAVGSRSTVGRFGGDEFVVIVGDARSESDIVEVAEALFAAVAEPFRLPTGEQVYLTTSAGLSLSDIDTDGPTLIQQADSARFRAKDLGRSRWELFDDGLRRRAHARLTTQAALRRALAGDELVLHYQPIVSLDSQALLGVEALIRWEHPLRGLLGPGEFIPVAEESGLICDVGEWVLDAAARQTRVWADAGRWEGRTTSVNVATAQLDATLPSRVADAARRAGVDPSLLRVEITETMLLSDTKAAEVVLRELREMGVHASIDDFGTGYSSLAYLAELSVDTLKIDRAFVTMLGESEAGRTITGAITTVARALGMRSIAEGVELPDQVAMLRDLGCDAMQGYLVSRPVPADEIAAML